MHLSAAYLGAFEFSFALGFILLGSSVTLIVIVKTIYLSIFFAFFCGLAFIFINVNLSTLRSAATPCDFRARMSAMASFLSSLANPFAVAIAGWYINWLGVMAFSVISGVAVILIAPVVLCSQHLRNALSLDDAQMRGYYERTYPEAFKLN